jgi:hypothetical protein
MVEELRLRERIESFHLSGMRPVEIRDALASAVNVAPIELSVRQIQAHLKAIREGWTQSLHPEVREAEWAEILAGMKDTARTAASASARYRDLAVGVGYANTRIKALNSAARLLGFVEPPRGHGVVGTPAGDHPYESLSRDEQPAELRRLASILEETP